jgi:hypothetical protein
MLNSQKYIFLFLTIILFLPDNLAAQSWKYIKEKDGIKLYTRDVANSSLKSIKGDAVFHTSIEKLCSLLANANNTDWWDKNIKEVKVLSFERNNFVRYYLVYSMPWPFTDRDLVVESSISANALTNERTVLSIPLSNLIPESKDLVRIKKYWQKWTLLPIDNGNIHVILEGYIDPGGNIPAWLYNMAVTDAPLKAMSSLRERILSNKPIKN